MITDRTSARDVTASDITELIERRQRETNDLEFKVSVDTDLLKAACGIANAGGGYIIVGVAEDDQHCASAIVSVTDVGRQEESVRQRLRDGLAPRPVIEVVPLHVSDADVIVIRISPQNPPHMVSFDKRTDFYGRYDATTERMRYEEIDQRFLEKHSSGAPIELAPTPRDDVATTLGRISVASGTKGALQLYSETLQASTGGQLAFIAVSDGNTGAIDDADAVAVLTTPLYYRSGGWLVANRDVEVSRDGAFWVQKLGPVSTTMLNASGDAIFRKPVDEVLCWRQRAEDFARSPRLYPNAIAEYCLSFAYLLADAAARNRPGKILIQPLLVGASGSHLPLGEGGSVWFDAPLEKPNTIDKDFASGSIIPIEVAGRPIAARHVAFLIAAEIYGMYGYRSDQVAFASERELTQESDPHTRVLLELRAYLQNILLLPLSPPVEQPDRRIYWFYAEYLGERCRIGVTNLFVMAHSESEAQLFALLDTLSIASTFRENAPTHSLLLKTSGLELEPR